MSVWTENIIAEFHQKIPSDCLKIWKIRQGITFLPHPVQCLRFNVCCADVMFCAVYADRLADEGQVEWSRPADQVARQNRRIDCRQAWNESRQTTGACRWLIDSVVIDVIIVTSRVIYTVCIALERLAHMSTNNSAPIQPNGVKTATNSTTVTGRGLTLFMPRWYIYKWRQYVCFDLHNSDYLTH